MKNALLGLNPYCHYKPTYVVHDDSPGIYSDDIDLNSSAINKIHLKCDVIDGSLVNGIRERTLFCFISDKPPFYKVFCQPQTVHF